MLSRHAEGSARSIDDPTPTQVAKHSHLLISPYYGSGSGETCVTGDVPLPTVTSKGRFGMVVPVTQSGGGAKARDVADPVPTMTTAKGGEFGFVLGTDHYDILFRMLEPHELAAAMGFDEEDRRYEFTGTKTEQIKQIGNAVSVRKMKACVGAIMADVAPALRDLQAVSLEAAE